MKSKTSRHGLKRMTALLLAVVLCIGMMPSAFAAQQDSYHDPAEHWQEANNRTNELDANAVVTIETFTCGECGKATSFEVLRTPEYTRDGQTALTRNVKYSDGTMVDGEGKGSVLDGVPGQDAYYTGYHWTKAICQTCGGINTNMGALLSRLPRRSSPSSPAEWAKREGAHSVLPLPSHTEVMHNGKWKLDR